MTTQSSVMDQASGSDVLLIENHGAVRVLVMNRPEKHNALNTPLTLALRNALRDADEDDSVHVVVLAANGKSFCAGADLSEFKDLTAGNPKAVEFRARLTTECQSLPVKLSKPVIGAVQGNAAGGGAGLALACDLVVAAENVRLFYPEVAHGISPAIVMAGLRRQMPAKLAFEVVMTKKRLCAEDLIHHGLANRIVPEADLRAAALEMAQEIAGHPVKAVGLTKELFYRVAEMPYDQAMLVGRDANRHMRSFRGQ